MSQTREQLIGEAERRFRRQTTFYDGFDAGYEHGIRSRDEKDVKQRFAEAVRKALTEL